MSSDFAASYSVETFENAKKISLNVSSPIPFPLYP